MSVDVYKDRPNIMTTTNSLKGKKRCDSCDSRVSVVTRKSDNKWYCNDCYGGEPLIVSVDDAEAN